MTSLKKYIRKIDESTLGAKVKQRKPLRRHTQIGELSEQVGLYDSIDDRWSKNAKRQFSKAELQHVAETQYLEFDRNETVLYYGKEVSVRIPNGPDNSVGIMTEGRMKMVNRAELVKLDEMVMGGMTELSPLNRMMQLAGISNPTIIGEDEIPGPEEVTSGLEEEDKEELEEDISLNIFQDLINKNKSQFDDDMDSTTLYVIGSLLGIISQELNTLGKGIGSTTSPEASSFLETQRQFIRTLTDEAPYFIEAAKTVYAKIQKNSQGQQIK